MGVLILLIRHAQAAEQNPELYPDDALRPLVPAGRKTQSRMARRLRRRRLVPSRVFSSPWKRAWQTARIVIRETGLPKDARIPCPALAVPPDLTAIAAEIGELRPDETIALVGHEPWLSGLASLLLTGGPALSIDFAKSGVLAIETESLTAGRGTLVLYLRP